jgi:hypothetical protein
MTVALTAGGGDAVPLSGEPCFGASGEMGLEVAMHEMLAIKSGYSCLAVIYLGRWLGAGDALELCA